MDMIKKSNMLKGQHDFFKGGESWDITKHKSRKVCISRGEMHVVNVLRGLISL